MALNDAAAVLVVLDRKDCIYIAWGVSEFKFSKALKVSID
jgi:hypothetical protein